MSNGKRPAGQLSRKIFLEGYIFGGQENRSRRETKIDVKYQVASINQDVVFNNPRRER
jgi:hypothetical protein